VSSSADEIQRWVRLAAAAADDKKATDVLIIDVGEVFSVSDYFIIASGSSTRQVHAIVDGIEERLTLDGGPKPARTEGHEDRQWVLMDYGTFIVHVFNQEQREFYQLEKLWGDRPRLDWEPMRTPEAG